LAFFDQIVNKLNKIEIKKDILDYVNTLGAFGKSNKNRRFSAYFCACIYRVKYKLILLDK
jgi:hypothetical protein